MSVFRIITVDELIIELEQHDHKELHVHHTWRPDHSNFTGKNHLQLQQNMRDFHVNSNGWSDIGQHVTLMPDGMFVTGRDFTKDPASISGYNKKAFEVEMLGNFDIGHDSLAGKQKDSMLRLAKYFYDKQRYIRFHRENAAKTCPGSSINKDVFINEVKVLGAKTEQIEREGKRLELKYQWQWNLLIKALEHLQKEGFLSSSEWVEKAKNKELTVDEVAWLSIILLGRKEEKE